MGDHQIHALAAIGPEAHATEAPALPAAQLQLAHLAAQRRCRAVDLGVATQSHDVAPAGSAAEPGDQLITGKGAIGQERDQLESGQEPIRLLQQSDRNRRADAGTGMLQGLPEQRNGPVVDHHGENHDAEAVPEHRGVKGKMQAVVWLLPVLERPEHQGAIQRLNVDATVGQPALTAALPAGSEAMGQRQTRLPAVETDGFAQQQPDHHPGQQDQVTPVGNGAVLTEKACELTVEPGSGIHERLDWCDNPNLSWLPAHPMS